MHAMFLVIEFSSLRIGVVVVPAGDHCQNMIFYDGEAFTMVPGHPAPMNMNRVGCPKMPYCVYWGSVLGGCSTHLA